MNALKEQSKDQINKELKVKLIKKSIPQLERMIKNKKNPYYELLRDYYNFRDIFALEEMTIVNKARKLKHKIDRASAPNRETWLKMKDDYARMQEDIIWIRNIYFDLPEKLRKNPPKRDFYRSEFV